MSLPLPSDSPSTAYFDAACCRNCGAALHGPHCAQCGQKKSQRLGLGNLRSEAWEKLRLFELDALQSTLRLLTHPGRVAREYVLGMRKRHTHPLKLLLLAIAVLLLVLAQTRYLDSANANVSKTLAVIRKYAEWSFSLGLAAVWLASMAAFRRGRGYNAAEHLVLALYTQFLIILVNIVNQLPLLVLRAPEWLAWHRAWSGRYMDLIEPALVLLACSQFFQLDLRRDGWRLLLAGAAFVASKKILIYLYSWLLVKLVLAKVIS
jgi:hypothetical protein